MAAAAKRVKTAFDKPTLQRACHQPDPAELAAGEMKKKKKKKEKEKEKTSW